VDRFALWLAEHKRRRDGALALEMTPQAAHALALRKYDARFFCHVNVPMAQVAGIDSHLKLECKKK